MNKIFLLGFACVAAFVFFASCSDEPNAVGIGVLPRNDTLRVDTATVYGTSDTTFLLRATGSPTRLLLGHYQYLRAITLLQFGGFSRIPAGAILDSAVISFLVDYRFKDATGLWGFEVHKMLRSWKELTFTWDSLSTPGTIRPTADTTFFRPVTLDDTTIYVRIDGLVNEWRNSGVDAPEGLILIPDSLVSNIILGFRNESVVTEPLLKVVYHNPGDTAEVSIALTLSQSSFLTDGNPPPLPSLQQIQAGVYYRELVHFDSLLSVIPQRGSIVKATLELSTDSASGLRGSISNDSILVYSVRENTAPYTSLAYATLCSPAYIGGQKIYRGDVRNIVQQWATVSPNYGIVVKAYDEPTTVDRIALYGSGAAHSLKPRVKILYTILP